MNILVTGSAGFIGSSLCDKLLDEGYNVTGIDNFDDFYPRSIKEMNLVRLRMNKDFYFTESDIRDCASIEAILKQKRIGLVIHLAARAGVRPSIEKIREYYDVNINGTLSVLEAMKKTGVRKMIFASSSSVYGNNPKVPFSESDNVDNPISPYASTKKSGELLCHVYSHLHGFNITCLRFFTVFGPRQRPDLAIHKFVRLIDNGKPVEVYGDGSSGRDYTFIEDILQGIVCAIEHLDGYRIYNLGESRIVRLKMLVEMIEEILDTKAEILYKPMQEGDVNITYADISKAKSEIGYDPKFNFREGLVRFIDWYKNNKILLPDTERL